LKLLELLLTVSNADVEKRESLLAQTFFMQIKAKALGH